MKQALLVSLILIALCFTVFAEQEEMKPSAWPYAADITVDTVPDNGLITITVPPEVYDKAQPDLSDLRVYDPDGDRFLGYYLLEGDRHHSADVQWIKARLYNEAFVPYVRSSVVADFGEKRMRDGIRIVVSGLDYKRRVTVEGSDDGKNWQKLASRGMLIRLRPLNNFLEFKNEMIDLPANDFRYLRVTAIHDRHDEKRIVFREISMKSVRLSPPLSREAKLVDTTIAEKPDDKTTEIEIGLANGHLPLYELDLAFDEPNYFRRVKVFGRDSATTMRKKHLEGGAVIEEEIEVPWKYMTEGAIYSFEGEHRVEKALPIHLYRGRYKHLRIVIQNLDDAPLTFKKAVVTYTPGRISFAPKQATTFQLLFGNPKAKAPHYDLAYYVDKLEKEQVVVGSVGNVIQREVPAEQKPEAPWYEKYSAVLWIVLVLVGLVLGYLVYDQMRSVKNEKS